VAIVELPRLCRSLEQSSALYYTSKQRIQLGKFWGSAMSVWARLAIACALSCSANAASPQEQTPLLPKLALSPCSIIERPELPDKWRATYLMAPFTSGQLMVGELIHDASLSAMRMRLFGVRRGALDLLIAGTETYLLESKEGGLACRRWGDTGWRPLPHDWLTPQSQCVGSAPIGGTEVDWWKTPLQRPRRQRDRGLGA